MLKRYLALLVQKGILSQVEIAAQLGVSLGLAAEMTAQLLRLGYLQALGAPDCLPTPETGCSDCPTHSLCLSATLQKGWSLSEKGQKALAAGY